MKKLKKKHKVKPSKTEIFGISKEAIADRKALYKALLKERKKFVLRKISFTCKKCKYSVIVESDDKKSTELMEEKQKCPRCLKLKPKSKNSNGKKHLPHNPPSFSLSAVKHIETTAKIPSKKEKKIEVLKRRKKGFLF